MILHVLFKDMFNAIVAVAVAVVAVVCFFMLVLAVAVVAVVCFLVLVLCC